MATTTAAEILGMRYLNCKKGTPFIRDERSFDFLVKKGSVEKIICYGSFKNSI